MPETFKVDIFVADESCDVIISQSGKITWKGVGEFDGRHIDATGLLC